MQVSKATMTSNREEGLSLLRLLDPLISACPWEFFHRLRTADPVHWDAYMHAWVVTSYSEVVTVLRDYSANRTPAPEYLDKLGLSFMKPFAEMMLQQMLFMDPPMHARLRSICSAAFTPSKVDRLRVMIQSTADDLIDKIIASGHMDVLSDFAIPFPAIVTARLLGVPVEDHRQLGAWVIDLAEVLGNFQHHPDRVAEIVRSLEDMKSYVASRVAEQRIRPNDGLINSLMNAEIDGERLTDDEVIASTIITMIGGHETTTNLIASGLLTLLERPESFDLLKSHPEIAATAVEELLRYESPVQHTARIAPADMQLGGKTIKKGSRVVAVLAAANRDPDRFPDPDRLDLHRPDNRHLAFGWAAHYCFGAPLARMEGQIAFNTILRRLSGINVLPQTLEWRENAGLRGLTALNIGFEAGVSLSTV
jgi:pimeloyl-[acyl-carrier protein] synthase